MPYAHKYYINILFFVIASVSPMNNYLSNIVTGNANFNMNQTSLQLLGFTQPQSALPIIHNAQNNAKGFTSRILWYFPTPIYSRLGDLELSAEERQTIQEGEETLGNNFNIHNYTTCMYIFLANLQITFSSSKIHHSHFVN
jgi:hypothetical protein